MLLSLQNIYKTYNQGDLDVPVLKDINMQVNAGEYIAIMGPSGSGKSTLMNIIGCLDRPTSGTYLLDGVDIMSADDNKLSETRARDIGFVFQSFQLLSQETALGNVMLPLSFAGVKRTERKGIADAALKRVGLEDRMDFYPSQLSGGQKQRVAIARALVNNPKILLADEPTGALDQASGAAVMELFEQLNKEGVTVLLITHDAAIGSRAHRMLHIIDGMLSENTENAEASAEAQTNASQNDVSEDGGAV